MPGVLSRLTPTKYNKRSISKKPKLSIAQRDCEPHPIDKVAEDVFKNEEEMARAMEDVFTAVVNGDTATAEALEESNKKNTALFYPPLTPRSAHCPT